MALGVQTVDDGFHVMIPKHVPLPARHTEIFTTVADGTTEIEVVALEADRAGKSGTKVGTASSATSVGTFKIVGLPPKACAEVQVAVTFAVTTSGRLHVEAVERSTGASARIAIERTRAAP